MTRAKFLNDLYRRLSVLTPEQAERIPPDLPPRPRFPLWAALPALAAGLGLGAALYYTDRGIPLALGCGGLAAGLILLVFALLTRNRLRLWEDLAAQKRAQRRDALLRYAAQYRAAEEARKESAARAAAYDGLYNALTANEQGILLEVRRFAPAALIRRTSSSGLMSLPISVVCHAMYSATAFCTSCWIVTAETRSL